MTTQADDHVWITLEEKHLAFCEDTAVKRRENAVEFGLQPANNAPVDYNTALALDRLGLPGELAGKLYLNPVKWNAFRRGKDFTEADLEDWIDVKTRSEDWHDLIVQFGDEPEWAYVLALAHELPRLCLVGWCWGYEAMQERFRADPAGGRPAFFIPQSDPILRPMSTLLAEVRRRQRQRQRPGFVGYDDDGHFLHYCDCGKWGAFGYGVAMLKGELGKWYCDEHKPEKERELC